METTTNIMAAVIIALTLTGAIWLISEALCIWRGWRRIRKIVARKHARRMKAMRDLVRSMRNRIDLLHLERSRVYEKGGWGVANVIRTALCDIVVDNLGYSIDPHAGVKSADVTETNMLVSRFADYVAREIDTFKEGIKLRNARTSQWGKASVRSGVSKMMSLSYTRNSWLLRDFAKIWAKEHKDERRKDLLSTEQIKRWCKFSAQERRTITLLCGESKLNFFR